MTDKDPATECDSTRYGNPHCGCRVCMKRIDHCTCHGPHKDPADVLAKKILAHVDGKCPCSDGEHGMINIEDIIAAEIRALSNGAHCKVRCGCFAYDQAKSDGFSLAREMASNIVENHWDQGWGAESDLEKAMKEIRALQMPEETK